MNKKEYLNQKDVLLFINYLNNLLDDENHDLFYHQYVDVKTQSRWECKSIYDAFTQYNWKGLNYIETEKILNKYKNELNNAVNKFDNQLCFDICEEILNWGGVLGSSKFGNKKKLIKIKEYLANYLAKSREYFHDELNLDINNIQFNLEIDGKKTEIIMNAGFTKIYSLLCDNFIIYDGRVGGAIGYLVRIFLQSKNNVYKEIPKYLNFYYGKAKNPNVNRNPSNDKYKFKSLSSSYSIHTRNNIMANWIIDKLDINKKNGFENEKNPIRAFESALFMIGYRI